MGHMDFLTSSAAPNDTSVVQEDKGRVSPTMDMSRFANLAKIGEGSYSEVFKARDKNNDNAEVAVKKIFSKKLFEQLAMREIGLLQSLKHENIIQLIEACRADPTFENNFDASLYLVMEFVDHDLAGILANRHIELTLSEKKMILKQLFCGLSYIHNEEILHRDLKPENILITRKGILKIADFGIARSISCKKKSKQPLASNVVTLWYRGPELLLGSTNYGPSIDMWSVGCIMAELWTRTPILMGSCEESQLYLITKLCGSISKEKMSEISNKSSKPMAEIKLVSNFKRRVIDHFTPVIGDADACDLLDKLLIVDPGERLGSAGACAHGFLSADPPACSLEPLLSNCAQGMYQYFTRIRSMQIKAREASRRLALAPHDEFANVTF